VLKNRSLRLGIILAAALVVVGVLAYTFWPTLAGNRPTLMYFRSPT
jgi:hypothetical protein